MHHIILDSEIDFDGWRQAARTLALNGVNPSDVTWTVRGNEPELFETQNIEEPPGAVAKHLQRAGKIHRAGAGHDPAP